MATRQTRVGTSKEAGKPQKTHGVMIKEKREKNRQNGGSIGGPMVHERNKRKFLRNDIRLEK